MTELDQQILLNSAGGFNIKHSSKTIVDADQAFSTYLAIEPGRYRVTFYDMYRPDWLYVMFVKYVNTNEETITIYNTYDGNIDTDGLIEVSHIIDFTNIQPETQTGGSLIYKIYLARYDKSNIVTFEPID